MKTKPTIATVFPPDCEDIIIRTESGFHMAHYSEISKHFHPHTHKVGPLRPSEVLEWWLMPKRGTGTKSYI